MERINYNELHRRWIKGERDIDLAIEVKKSVSVLYEKWYKLGLLKNAAHSKEEWETYYEEYQTNRSLTTKRIAEEMQVSIATVYNKFATIGNNSKALFDKTVMLEEHKNGATTKALALKYQKTPTYIRYLIRTNRS